MELHELENQALHSIHHFKKDEIYYLPLPSSGHSLTQVGGARGIAKLRFVEKRKSMFSSHEPHPGKWTLHFDILSPSNGPFYAIVWPNASIYIDRVVTRFFTNYWHAYAYRLNAEASGWWL